MTHTRPGAPAHAILDPLGATEAHTMLPLLTQRAQRYARAEDSQAAIACTVVTFQRAKGKYAVALHELHEIRPLVHYCRVPGARAAAPGLVHYRGELLSLHDMCAYTSGEAGSAAPEWMLVVGFAGERMGLMADDVMDVVALPVGALRMLPVTMGEVGECFQGATEDGVLVLNVSRAFRTPQLARAF